MFNMTATLPSFFSNNSWGPLDPTLFEEYYFSDHQVCDWDPEDPLGLNQIEDYCDTSMVSPDELRAGGLHLDGDQGLVPVWSFYKGPHISGTVTWCPAERRFYDNSLSKMQDGILNGPHTADWLADTFREMPPAFCTGLVPPAVLREMLLATDPQGSVDEHIFLAA